MTDRSKSPRKRRLQLNAEEFAPPADMYPAADELRLDETWVQFYGGEKQGIKRLTDFDEATPRENIDDVTDPLQPNSPAEAIAHTVPQNIAKPAPIEHRLLSKRAKEQPARSYTRPTLSSISRFQDQEKHSSDSRPSEHISHEAPPPATRQITQPEATNVSDSPPNEIPFSEEPETDSPDFEEWSRRWAPWLKRGGSIKICEAFFKLTCERGSAECFTSNSEIMKLTDLSRAQCIRNIHYLIEMGFLEELSEVNNKEAKGTYYRFNLVPTSLIPS